VSRDAMRRVHFTGRLEHDQVSDLMGLSRVVVVPSTFPEAFGMVLAEAACCGSIPLSSSHSGLAEVTATLAPALPANLRDQLSFSLGPGAVSELAAKISGWLPALTAQPQVPAPAQPELTELASTHFGWPEVADGVVAAAQGRLSQLEPVEA
jgi:glycosyltransferase involved in cell wall biosynthesis